MTDYREPTDAEIAAIAHRFDGDTDRARDFARRFPPALGIEPNAGSAAAALADQLDAATNSAHRLAEDYVTNVARHLLVLDSSAQRFRKLRLIADGAEDAYDRAFSAPAGRPDEHPVGFTVPTETAFGAAPNMADTRCYAVLARVPDERMPVASRADLGAFMVHARTQNFCDLRYGAGLCDGAMWAEPVFLPIPRGDVIVIVSVCHSCWNAYLDKHGLWAGEVVDPDDVID